MRCCLVLAWVCLMSLSALAAPPTTTTKPADASSTGTVIGIAVDAAGKPLADCIVTATETAKRVRPTTDVQTDTEGNFSIDLPEGEWTLTITTKDTKLKGAKSVRVVAGKSFDVKKIVLKPRKAGIRAARW